MARNNKFSRANTYVEEDKSSYGDNWYKKLIAQIPLPQMAFSVITAAFAAGGFFAILVSDISKSKEDIASLHEKVADMQAAASKEDDISNRVKKSEGEIKGIKSQINDMFIGNLGYEAKFVLKTVYDEDMKKIGADIHQLQVDSAVYKKVEKHLREINKDMKADIEEIKDSLGRLRGGSK